jgi:hypothetical protein
MDTSLRVRIGDAHIEHSWAYAKLVIDLYARGECEQSRAFSYRGAEANEELWALAKMAECAFAMWADLDPLDPQILNWRGLPDWWDVVVFGWRVDVKHTVAGSRLIWPLRKKELFNDAQFDVLALVRGEPPAFEITGVVHKERFARHRFEEIKGGNLDPGTWYMKKGQLDHPRTLLRS